MLLTFYFIDASMRSGRDMDPLSRDSLRWTKLRYVLWAVNILGTIAVPVFFLINPNPAAYDSANPGLSPVSIIVLLSVLPFLVTYITAVVSLPIVAMRSKDPGFRRQLEWFALSSAFLFIILNLVPSSLPNNSPLQGYFQFWGFLIGGYSLYRSARALVPLNRRVEEVTTKK
jgi:amino acid transporter